MSVRARGVLNTAPENAGPDQIEALRGIFAFQMKPDPTTATRERRAVISKGHSHVVPTLLDRTFRRFSDAVWTSIAPFICHKNSRQRSFDFRVRRMGERGKAEEVTDYKAEGCRVGFETGIYIHRRSCVFSTQSHAIFTQPSTNHNYSIRLLNRKLRKKHVALYRFRTHPGSCREAEVHCA